MSQKTLQDYVADLGALTCVHHRELFDFEPADVERFRLTMLSKRFNDLKDRVGALKKLAAIQGVSQIDAIDDAVPVLFQHTVYKSYPMSFLEQGKFGALTKWLGQLTTHDLSAVKADQVHFVDDWFRLIEQHTPVTPIHTTGTSGKLSVIPRTARDTALLMRSSFSKWEGFGSERDMPLDFDKADQKLPIIHPTYRHGFYSALRLLDLQIRTFSSEDLCISLYDDWLSPDVLSLAGRVMAAEAKGEVDKLKITPELLERFRRNQDRQKNKKAADAVFFERVLECFQGQRIMLATTTPTLWSWVEEAQRRGIKSLFAPDSYIATGGGLKGTKVPDGWQQTLTEVVGAPLIVSYGMSELCSVMSGCSHGNYHVPPYLVPYVLDERSGDALPRHGEQTGRAAFFDLLPDSYWAGFITGDEVTMKWDGACACGRKGVYVKPTVRRFSEKHGGEDKISCAGAPDAQDKAMDFLSKVASSH